MYMARYMSIRSGVPRGICGQLYRHRRNNGPVIRFICTVS